MKNIEDELKELKDELKDRRESAAMRLATVLSITVFALVYYGMRELYKIGLEEGKAEEDA